MGSLWDDIRKSLKEGLETVADYTEEYTKIGRLKVDVASIKHSINRLFGELGGRVYELLSQDPHGQVAPDEKVRALIGRIKELEGKLREKEAEIEKVKQQKQEERKKKTSAAQTPAPEPQAKAAEAKPPRRQTKTTARKGQESESDEVVGM